MTVFFYLKDMAKSREWVICFSAKLELHLVWLDFAIDWKKSTHQPHHFSWSRVRLSQSVDHSVGTQTDGLHREAAMIAFTVMQVLRLMVVGNPVVPLELLHIVCQPVLGCKEHKHTLISARQPALPRASPVIVNLSREGDRWWCVAFRSKPTHQPPQTPGGCGPPVSESPLHSWSRKQGRQPHVERWPSGRWVGVVPQGGSADLETVQERGSGVACVWSEESITHKDQQRALIEL